MPQDTLCFVRESDTRTDEHRPKSSKPTTALRGAIDWSLKKCSQYRFRDLPEIYRLTGVFFRWPNFSACSLLDLC